MNPVRVLVVDDYEPFRRLIRTILRSSSLEIIGQASNGLEAVQKSAELQPDLILLDIGLPELNGIEAAARIGQLCPHSKIIFLTQETSWDIVEAALYTGAPGYVFKANAQRELLPAIHAVLRGGQFVSRNVKVGQVTDATSTKHSSRHEVMFYSDESGFAEGLCDFVAATLKSGKTAIAIATKSHGDGLVQRLKANSFDIDRAIQEGRYVALDSAETLGAIMVDGEPDRARLFDTVGGLITLASETNKREQRGIAACGECAPLVLAKGEPETAIRIEQLFDELIKAHSMDLLCAYSMSSFHGGQDDPVFKKICAEHSAVHFR